MRAKAAKRLSGLGLGNVETISILRLQENKHVGFHRLANKNDASVQLVQSTIRHWIEALHNRSSEAIGSVRDSSTLSIALA
jgi:hypothetical protein